MWKFLNNLFGRTPKNHIDRDEIDQLKRITRGGDVKGGKKSGKNKKPNRWKNNDGPIAG